MVWENGLTLFTKVVLVSYLLLRYPLGVGGRAQHNVLVPGTVFQTGQYFILQCKGGRGENFFFFNRAW